MDLSDAVDALYAVPLAEFVATRARLAAEAKGGDPDVAREIKDLRKPTTAAWLLNQVARAEPGTVTALNELGERMRAAQAKGDGAALAEARPERHSSIEALADAARRRAEDAGQKFGQAARDQVTSTAVAALADETSGRALASGHLLRALSYAGFGEVELDDAVAAPLRLVPPAEQADEAAAGVSAEEAERAERLERAGEELRELERSLGSARLARAEAAEVLAAADEKVADLEAEVTRAKTAVERLAGGEV